MLGYSVMIMGSMAKNVEASSRKMILNQVSDLMKKNGGSIRKMRSQTKNIEELGHFRLRRKFVSLS